MTDSEVMWLRERLEASQETVEGLERTIEGLNALIRGYQQRLKIDFTEDEVEDLKKVPWMKVKLKSYEEQVEALDSELRVFIQREIELLDQITELKEQRVVYEEAYTKLHTAHAKAKATLAHSTSDELIPIFCPDCGLAI